MAAGRGERRRAEELERQLAEVRRTEANGGEEDDRRWPAEVRRTAADEGEEAGGRRRAGARRIWAACRRRVLSAPGP